MNRYKKLVRNRKGKEEELKKNSVKVPCGDTPIIIDISSNSTKSSNDSTKLCDLRLLKKRRQRND